VDETFVGGGRCALKRVALDGTDRRTIMAVDGLLPGTPFRPSLLYPISTVSSDGKRLAVSCFLGDGQREDPGWGLLVFDLERAAVSLGLHGATWGNMHPQYSRSADPDASHDVLVQEDHGNRYAPDGGLLQRHAANRDVNPRLSDYAAEQTLPADRNFSGLGADIHVIRDDGTNVRTMPWGRDGNEKCQGHQCWRGRTGWAITSTMRHRPYCYETIESLPVAEAGHLGACVPGGLRNVLSREFAKPYFYHFATDRAGDRLIADAAPFDQGGALYVGDFGAPGKDAARFTWLLNPRASGKKESQIHPFLSPDGTMAFFNSDESGLLQAYMVKGIV
jgi:hypothetical protein